MSYVSGAALPKSTKNNISKFYTHGGNSQDINSGFLNVAAVRMAMETYLGRGLQVLCLVPRLWMAGGSGGGHLEASVVVERRMYLCELMDSGLAELEPEKCERGLPPLVSYALSKRAVLATTASGSAPMSPQLLPRCCLCVLRWFDEALSSPFAREADLCAEQLALAALEPIMADRR